MFGVAIGIYAAAMTIANLSVAAFGPAITPINAFLFIGLDLALRDLLHTKINKIQMLILILATSLLTYLLAPSAALIAFASAASFCAAALVDWFIFTKSSGSWFKKSNKSNIGGAAVDSVLFPTIAFGALLPHIVLMQFMAKILGGLFWSWLIAKFFKDTK
jgi:uncharacterized PurR-regulated membrane protein YhhQ (DUF165 family)